MIHTCPKCGAPMEYAGDHWSCMFCGHTIDDQRSLITSSHDLQCIHVNLKFNHYALTRLKQSGEDIDALIRRYAIKEISEELCKYMSITDHNDVINDCHNVVVELVIKVPDGGYNSKHEYTDI